MKKSNERLNHALHNKAVCNYLELKQEFADWIITTAFYTSLQFVSHKIFPFSVPAIEGKDTSITNIDQYHSYNNPKRISKHDLLADLVAKHCNNIHPDYDWLLDMSMTALYIQYKQDTDVARYAQTLMKRIKKHCTS